MSLNEIYDEAIFYSAWTYSSEFPRRSFMKTKIQAANNYKLTIKREVLYLQRDMLRQTAFIR